MNTSQIDDREQRHEPPIGGEDKARDDGRLIAQPVDRWESEDPESQIYEAVGMKEELPQDRHDDDRDDRRKECEDPIQPHTWDALVQ